MLTNAEFSRDNSDKGMESELEKGKSLNGSKTLLLLPPKKLGIATSSLQSLMIVMNMVICGFLILLRRIRDEVFI